MRVGRPTSTRAAVVAAALVLAGAASAAPPVFEGPTIKNPHAPADFALRDQHGTLVRLSALHGSVVLLTFLYTHCPDYCPLTAERLNGALQSLGAARAHVRVVAVSVDPAGDTRRSVAAFIRRHGLLPQFVYLTGTRAALSRIWRLYGVQSRQHAGDRVDHTLFTLLLDRQGRGRVLYDSSATSSSISHDVRLLLGRA